MPSPPKKPQADNLLPIGDHIEHVFEYAPVRIRLAMDIRAYNHAMPEAVAVEYLRVRLAERYELIGKAPAGIEAEIQGVKGDVWGHPHLRNDCVMPCETDGAGIVKRARLLDFLVWCKAMWFPLPEQLDRLAGPIPASRMPEVSNMPAGVMENDGVWLTDAVVQVFGHVHREAPLEWLMVKQSRLDETVKGMYREYCEGCRKRGEMPPGEYEYLVMKSPEYGLARDAVEVEAFWGRRDRNSPRYRVRPREFVQWAADKGVPIHEHLRHLLSATRTDSTERPRGRKAKYSTRQLQNVHAVWRDYHVAGGTLVDFLDEQRDIHKCQTLPQLKRLIDSANKHARKHSE